MGQGNRRPKEADFGAVVLSLAEDAIASSMVARMAADALEFGTYQPFETRLVFRVLHKILDQSARRSFDALDGVHDFERAAFEALATDRKALAQRVDVANPDAKRISGRRSAEAGQSHAARGG